MNTILEVKNLKKTYNNCGNETEVLHNISFRVDEGEFVCIMGASGSGKTTLLNCISTIDSITSGEVYLDNKNMRNLKSKDLSAFRRKKIGFIFQDYNLIDTLTIFENIALALSINGVKEKEIKEKEIKERVISISKKLQIDSVLQKYPYEISGGQKQRCACARAIVNEPVLILADEPTGALDSISSKKLMELLSYMNSDLNETIIMVTHDPVCASYAKRVIFLKDGSIYQELRDDKKPLQYNAIIQTIETSCNN